VALRAAKAVVVASSPAAAVAAAVAAAAVTAEVSAEVATELLQRLDRCASDGMKRKSHAPYFVLRTPGGLPCCA
jgi:hypothetical protein